MKTGEFPRGTLVALTGATGFLGSHIADVLLARGYRVRASVRPSSDLRWLSGKPIQTQEVVWDMDRATDRTVRSLDEFLVDAAGVIHCAGTVRADSEAAYHRGNVETTRLLLAAATRSACCHVFVLVSSLAAAGPAPLAHPRREDDPCRPITAYGRSKLAAEQLLLAAHAPLRSVILRPPALYGPRDRAFLPLLRLALRGWMPRLGRNLTGLSLVDGRDAAAAAVGLLESPAATGPYFVDDGKAYTWAEMAAALGAACGRRVRTFGVSLALLRAARQLLGARLAGRLPLLHGDRLADLEAVGWACSGQRLRQEIGFEAANDLQQGFRETLAFYRRQGWIHAA